MGMMGVEGGEGLQGWEGIFPRSLAVTGREVD